MKTILTLIFVLFIGVAAQAQNDASEVKVETVTMSITTAKQEVALKNENSVARLYMFKNSKITKELSFSTKLNKAKLA
ncbi:MULTISPECIES: hypothetical protein [Arenibacter]|uniref:hypothetical protein n=1 Tax=Arenibacter TaxID=178469 RepID=UPI001C078277|nr:MULTISPECIES: hypothetical protein [Arenibacter]MBU2903760.1 hypothetical protein [Arenibacter algicola]MCK0134040.1 hypothetical protein [Arenibacter sp. S6351L]